MAQRNSATAKGDVTVQDARPDGAVAAERARAAAYIDLWERQLRHAAAQGPVTVAGRRSVPRQP